MMPVLIFIAAYFTLSSLRKGPWRCIRDKRVRLGIPLMAGVLVFISPGISYTEYFYRHPDTSLNFLKYWSKVYLPLAREPYYLSANAWPPLAKVLLVFSLGLASSLAIALSLSLPAYLKHSTGKSLFKSSIGAGDT